MSVSRIASRLLVSGLRCARTAQLTQSSSILQQQSTLTAARSFCCSAQRGYASKTTEDLAQFLSEEIKAEKDNQRESPKIEGFKVEQEGADLKFTKDFQSEKITVQLNINHTVDSSEPDDGSEEAPEMKSRPNFEVDIEKGGKTLSFTCSYIHEHDGPEREAKEQGFEDVFTIDEVTMYEGEWTEKNYAVAGDILDGQLYDLFMNMLDERGVTQGFADNLSDYCSTYEHSRYIKVLEDVQKFVK